MPNHPYESDSDEDNVVESDSGDDDVVEADSDEDDVEIRSVSSDSSQSASGGESPDSRGSDGDHRLELLLDDDDAEAFYRNDIFMFAFDRQPTVTSPSSRSSITSDNSDDDGRRSPMSTDDEEEPVTGDESTDASWGDSDDHSEVPPDDDEEALSRSPMTGDESTVASWSDSDDHSDEDKEAFSRSSSRGSMYDNVVDGHRSPTPTDNEDEPMDDDRDRVNVDDDDFRMQRPSNDEDADADGEQSLPPQALEESLRSQLRCALNALAERDATIQDLQKSLDEKEAARAELQVTVGRLEAKVEELDVSVLRWCSRALDADERVDRFEDERNTLREGRDRQMDDRRHERCCFGRLKRRLTGRRRSATRQDEMDRRTRSTERLREDLNEKARRIQDLNGVLEANQRRIIEMEEDNRRLKARVRAQQLLDLTIRVEDTEYIQDPNDIVAHITKAGMIALFRNYVVGKRRSREDTDDLAAQLSAEALDLVGVSEEYHAEKLDVLPKVAKRIFRDRDTNAIKRRRVE